MLKRGYGLFLVVFFIIFFTILPTSAEQALLNGTTYDQTWDGRWVTSDQIIYGSNDDTILIQVLNTSIAFTVNGDTFSIPYTMTFNRNKFKISPKLTYSKTALQNNMINVNATIAYLVFPYTLSRAKDYISENEIKLGNWTFRAGAEHINIYDDNETTNVLAKSNFTFKIVDDEIRLYFIKSAANVLQGNITFSMNSWSINASTTTPWQNTSADGTTYNWLDSKEITLMSPYGDEFNTGTLNSTKWKWIREPTGNWSNGSTYLQINTTETDLYSSSTSPILYQNTSSENLTIITNISALPDADYESGGLIFYQDDNNWVRGQYYYTTGIGGKGTIICIKVSGSPSCIATVAISSDPVYLKLVKSGNDYSLYHSPNKTSWTLSGSMSAAITPINVGVLVHGAPSTDREPYRFDYFMSDNFTGRTGNLTAFYDSGSGNEVNRTDIKIRGNFSACTGNNATRICDQSFGTFTVTNITDWNNQTLNITTNYQDFFVNITLLNGNLTNSPQLNEIIVYSQVVEEETSIVYNDEFNDLALNTTLWDLTSGADYNMTGTAFRINTSATNLYGAQHDAPQLLQNITVGTADTLSIETRLNITQINYEGGGGLIMKVDDNNFVYGTYYTTTSNDERLYFLTNINGTGAGEETFASPGEQTQIWLNITKSNISYTLYYKLNEIDAWIKVKSFEMRNPTTIGIIAIGDGTANKSLYFDYFRLNHTSVSISQEALASDEFNGLISSNWFNISYYNDPLTSSATYATIEIPSGSGTRDIFSGYSTPKFLQWINNSNFDITVKFNSNFSNGTQDQGIIIRDNISDFMRFDVHTDGTYLWMYAGNMSDYIIAERTYGGNSKGYLVQGVSIPFNDSFYMRVKRLGNAWAQFYSLDNITWVKSAGFNHTINVSAVGLYAATSSYLPAFNANFDYFHVSEALSDSVAPVTTFFYGDYQKLGNVGHVQDYVNIVGNVFDESEVSSVLYSLNNGTNQTVNIGADGYRLELTNDFNIELDYYNLNCGNNTLDVFATDSNGYLSRKPMVLNYSCSVTTQFPLAINWSDETNIQDVVQVIDGNWNIGSKLNLDAYGYDRLVSFGDQTWKDYEVTVPITINTAPSSGDKSNFGIVMRWNEHIYDGSYPRKQWYPVGALALYIWNSELNGFKLSIVAGGYNSSNGDGLYFSSWDNDTILTIGSTYIFKSRVETVNSTHSKYSLRAWLQGTTEPATWNTSAIISSEESSNGEATGSVLLAAHKSDVSFGNITVTEISYIPPAPASLSYTNGTTWVNHTWSAGSGNVTDSYSVFHNGTWTNESIISYFNSSVGYGTWSNISVYAWNSTGNGRLSSASSQNVKTPSQTEFIPPAPTEISETHNIIGRWINTTWQAGTGFVSNTYNVSANGAWTNGSSSSINVTVLLNGWSNVTVFAYNSSGTGHLSVSSASLNTQLVGGTPNPIQSLSYTKSTTWINWTWLSGDT